MVSIAPAPLGVRKTVARGASPRSARSWVGWGFMAPLGVIFLFALVAPIVYSIYLSLFQERLIGGNSFAGLANYAFALSDPQFYDALGRVVLFLFIQVPLMLAISAFAALALDSSRLRFASFYRIALFLPFAVPGVIAALMWGFIYGTDFGLVGNLNSFFGLSIPSPLASEWVLTANANISTWAFLGYNMLVMYSALRTVPRELYESAAIDGAGTFRVIRSIKLPAMKPALVITLIFSVIGSFQLFNGPNVLKSLSPNTISSNFTPNMYAYNLAFSGQQYNYAAAIAIIMGVLTMVVAYVVQTVGIRKSDR